MDIVCQCSQRLQILFHMWVCGYAWEHLVRFWVAWQNRWSKLCSSSDEVQRWQTDVCYRSGGMIDHVSSLRRSAMISITRAKISEGRNGDIVECWMSNFIDKRCPRSLNWAFRVEESKRKQKSDYFFREKSPSFKYKSPRTSRYRRHGRCAEWGQQASLRQWSYRHGGPGALQNVHVI